MRASVKRKLLVFGSLLLLLSLAIWVGWREWRVRSIPDVGTPFDEQAFLSQFDIKENAYDVFRKAEQLHAESISEQVTKDLWREDGKYFDAAVADGASADETTLRFLELNRPALELWLSASKVEEGYETHPLHKPPAFYSGFGTSDRNFCRSFQLQTSILVSGGNSKEVWEYYCQYLKCIRHLKNGGTTKFSLGNALESLLNDQFPRLLLSKNLTITELQTIRIQLEEIYKSYRPLSHHLKVEYLQSQRAGQEFFAERSWLNFLSAEVSVYQRILDLMYQNWLSNCDLPAWNRAALIAQTDDASSLSLLKRHQSSNSKYNFCFFNLGPETEVLLNAHYKLSYSQDHLLRYFKDYMKQGISVFEMLLKANDKDRLQRQVNLAFVGLHIYQREHGHFPATLEELVPQYLTELPRTPDKTGKPLIYTLKDSKAVLSTEFENLSFTTQLPNGNDP